MEPAGSRIVDFRGDGYNLQAERRTKREGRSSSMSQAEKSICADEGVGTGPEGKPGCPILLEDFRTVVPGGGLPSFRSYLSLNRLREVVPRRSAKDPDRDPVGWYTQSRLSSSIPVTYRSKSTPVEQPRGRSRRR